MNPFVKMIVVIIFVVAALLGVFYIEGGKKAARVADITVFVEVQDGVYVRIPNIEGPSCYLA